jgi:hypothetical protein
MGKNSPERQEFIIRNLKMEEEMITADVVSEGEKNVDEPEAAVV